MAKHFCSVESEQNRAESEGVNLQAFKDQWSLDTAHINLSRPQPVGGLHFCSVCVCYLGAIKV